MWLKFRGPDHLQSLTKCSKRRLVTNELTEFEELLELPQVIVCGCCHTMVASVLTYPIPTPLGCTS